MMPFSMIEYLHNQEFKYFFLILTIIKFWKLFKLENIDCEMFIISMWLAESVLLTFDLQIQNNKTV